MEAYKFETIIMEDGIIKIPELSAHKDHKIEVIVVLKPEKKKQANATIEEFLAQWSGFFKIVETDDIRYNALMEKHK
jgi:DNA-binding protein H-NS